MGQGEARTAWAASASAFLVAAAGAVVVALRGGMYDIVDRQALGLLVWWVLALGIALGLLPRARPRPVAYAPVMALALLGAWTLLSLGWTASDERTLAEVTRVATYAGIVLLVLLAVDRRRWRAAAAGLAAGALAVAGVATAARLAPDLFPADRVGETVGRLSYPFDYWNAVGVWGAMAVSAGVAWSVAAPRTAFRGAFLAAVPAAGLSIYLSYSRASIAGLAVGVVLAVALCRPRPMALVHAAAAAIAAGPVVLVARAHPDLARGQGTDGAAETAVALLLASIACGAVALLTSRFLAAREWTLPARPARAAALAAGAALLAAAAIAGPGLASRAWDSFRSTEEAVVLASDDPAQRFGTLQGVRYLLWSVALDEARNDPGTGTGAGTFEFAWNRAGRSPVIVRDAHSLYIEPLAELGWPGALLTLAFVASLVVVGVASVRRTSGPAARNAVAACLAPLAVWIVQAAVDWMWEITAVSALALAATALCSAALADGGRRRPLPVAARLPAVAACLVVCALMVPGLASSSLVRESQASVRAGDLERATDEAADAVAAQPWATSPLLQRATVAEAGGDLRGARADLRRAAAREPLNWRARILLARVEARLGRPAAALREIRRARRLRPRAVLFETVAKYSR